MASSKGKKRKAPSRKSPQRRGQRPSTEGHAAEATEYAEDIVAGKILACKWVKLACQRHLDDLEKQSNPKYPYRFISDWANRACDFIQSLPHTKGKWGQTSQLIALQPWQKFIVCNLFGWAHKGATKYRFTDSYVEIPRKNGKSITAAGIGLYKFAADDEFGAEVYSGATSEKQAWEVFRPAKQMAERTAELRETFGIEVNAKSLVIPSTGSRFEPVIGKPGDGASPSLAIIDEYHEHQSDALTDTMRTGMAARDNPLTFKITTAGSDRSSPCYAERKRAEKVLNGLIQVDDFFCIIFTIDEGDDWKSELAIRKANPNLDVSVSSDFLRGELSSAIDSARKQNTYKTKYLDLWVNAAVSWMNMAKWDEAADPKLRIEDFEKEECILAIDLAQLTDLASALKLFKKIIDGQTHYYAFPKHYLNEFAVEEASNAHYAGWAKEERLIVTPGNRTDYTWIAEDLVKDSEKFIIREVPYDPYHGAALVQFIQKRPDWDQTIEFVEVRQTFQNMSPAMKELEALVLSGRFHHDGDPVYTWQIGNVVCRRDNKDNIFPDKERPENKIDAAVTTMMALKRSTDRDAVEDGSVYDKRGVQSL